MKTKMKDLMKNKNMQPNKIWLITVQLIVLSLFLVLSQLTLAKDRIQYHVQNFDGSTLKVINEQGVVSQSYQYAPFGQQLQYKKPSNLKNPNAFVGGTQDADDLVYLKQRHYNPVLGRFYQPDPVTYIMKGHGQTNRYQYGWNDTYTFSDSNGLQSTGQWLDDQAMRAANVKNNDPSFLNNVSLFNWSFANVTWKVLGAENISLWYDGQETSKIGLGFEAVAAVPFVGPIARISTTGKMVDQYALTAAKNGFYPVMVRGFKEPQAGVWLNAGEVWKYGTTQNPTTRYTTNFLLNTGKGLEYQQMLNGIKQFSLISEKQHILLYKSIFGHLPPGNKIVR